MSINRCTHAVKIKYWLIAVLAMYTLQPLFAISGTVSSCDLQQGPCVVETNGLTITFEILPKPARTMSELRFIVMVKRKNDPVTDIDVALDLSMPGMYMGKNRSVLKHVGQGTYQGTGSIPRCASGQRTWQAKVTVDRTDPETIALFQFEVQ